MTMTSSDESLGAAIDRIGQRLDWATRAWVEAGYPDHGPEAVAREEAVLALHRWNHRVSGPLTVPCETCDSYTRRILQAGSE